MANRVSLKRLYNLNKTSNTPFLGTTETLETLPFMAEYLTYFAKIDRNFVRNHKSWYPTYNLQDEDTEADVLEAWKDNIDDFLITNKETYTRMWNLFITEYRPLDNYDRYEHIIDQHSGIDQNTDDIASRVNTSNYGKISGTNTYGEVNNKDNIGTQNGDITNKKAGFNSTTFVDTDAQHNVSGAREDLHHEDSKIDKNEVDARTDKNTTDAYTDIHETNYGHRIEHTNETHGNIGVTTSQQMAQSEVDFWSAYNFYKVILNDIIRSLCNIFDDAPDAFSFDYGDSIKLDPVISGGDKPTPIEKYYKLTVIDKYLSNNKLVTYDTVERSVEELKEGSTYSVNALTIDGYNTDTQTLTGTITEDTTITFTYVASANLTKVTVNCVDRYYNGEEYNDIVRESVEFSVGGNYSFIPYLYPIGFDPVSTDAVSGLAYKNNQNVIISYTKREHVNYTLDSLLAKLGLPYTAFEYCDYANKQNKNDKYKLYPFVLLQHILSMYNSGVADTIFTISEGTSITDVTENDGENCKWFGIAFSYTNEGHEVKENFDFNLTNGSTVYNIRYNDLVYRDDFTGKAMMSPFYNYVPRYNAIDINFSSEKGYYQSGRYIYFQIGSVISDPKLLYCESQYFGGILQYYVRPSEGKGVAKNKTQEPEFNVIRL